MEFPIKVNVKVKRSTLKDAQLGRSVVENLAFTQLTDQIRKLNLVQLDENEYEFTAKIEFTISNKYKVI